MAGDRGFAVVKDMIDIYYDRHEDEAQERDDLIAYAKKRLELCPHGDDKPFCNNCEIHCYDDDHRAKIRKVMKFSGPRMAILRPKASLDHLVEEIKFKFNKGK